MLGLGQRLWEGRGLGGLAAITCSGIQGYPTTHRGGGGAAQVAVACGTGSSSGCGFPEELQLHGRGV